MKEAIAELKRIAEWLESSIQQYQHSFDEPPEYATVEDCQMAQTCDSMRQAIRDIETAAEGMVAK